MWLLNLVSFPVTSFSLANNNSNNNNAGATGGAKKGSGLNIVVASSAPVEQRSDLAWLHTPLQPFVRPPVDIYGTVREGREEWYAVGGRRNGQRSYGLGGKEGEGERKR